MTVSALTGPVLFGTDSPWYLTSGSDADNPAPSGSIVGSFLIDPRMGVVRDCAPGSPWAIGFFSSATYCAINQAPSAAAVGNIAAAQVVTSGTAMNLVTTSAAGITVTTSLTSVLQSGQTVAAGARVIDSVPTLVSYGQGSIRCVDPRTQIARVVSITGSASATGGNFDIVGADLYGVPQTERIVAGAGAVTTNGKKGWKFILSVTPRFTDAHTYSVGTADLFELPFATYDFAGIEVAWANGWLTNLTTFVPADTTSPATMTTGSVRGTIGVPSASDGTRRLQVFQSIWPYNAANTNGPSSLFGVVPA